MAAPLIIYGIIVMARVGLSLAALNNKQQRNIQAQKTFMYDGGAVYHEYC
jgi:hypothetical protein